MRRLEELVGLPEDASLGGAKDEVQGNGRESAGEQGDEHDLSTKVIQVQEDRCRIPPDPNDRDDLAVELDREVGAQDVVRRQDDTDGLGVGDWMEPSRDGSASSGGEVGRRHPASPGRVGGVRQDERAVGRPDLDAQDLSVSEDRPDLGTQGSGAGRRRTARSEVGRDQVRVGEATYRRRVRANDRIQHRLRRLGRHDDRLAQRGQTHDHQEEAEDDDQQDRPPKRTKWCTEQELTPG